MMSLNEEVEACSETEKELKKALGVIADEFDQHQRRLDVAKLAFAGTGVAGGGLTIVGLALAPFTMGASLVLAIAGGTVGGVSAIGNIGSLIADTIISKKAFKNAETKLREYSRKLETICLRLPDFLDMLGEPERILIQEIIESSNLLSEDVKKKLITKLHDVNLNPIRATTSSSSAAESIISAQKIISKAIEAGKVLDEMATAAKTSVLAANGGRAIATAADAGTDVAAGTGKAAAVSGVKYVGVAATGVGLALDVGAVIYYGHKIHKNTPSELAKKIRKIANCLN